MLVVWICIIWLIGWRRPWRGSKPSGAGMRTKTTSATVTSVVACKEEEYEKRYAHDDGEGNPTTPVIPVATSACVVPSIVVTCVSTKEDSHSDWRDLFRT